MSKSGRRKWGTGNWGLTPFITPFITLLALGWSLQATGAPLPDFGQVRSAWRSSDAWLIDRNGRAMQRLRVDMAARRFEWTGIDAVSPALVRPLLAAEDQRFFEHAGVDWQAAMNAALDNLGPGKRRGASTLTMQLAGLLDPELARADDNGGSHTMAQKLRQARAALALEKTWSKARILEAYLNLVTFRGELQGVSAMSHGLFGKAPHGLNTREAAIAAALMRGPNADANKVAERACGLVGSREGASGPRSPRSQACEGLATEVRQVLARGYEAFPKEDAAPHAARRLFARDGVAPGGALPPRWTPTSRRRRGVRSLRA